MRAVLAFVLCGALAACGGLASLALPPAQVAQLQRVCEGAAPLLNVAAAPGMPATVSQTAVYGAAYCNQLLAGSVPPTTDANTPSWLPGVIRGVRAAASAAKVVLPIVLPMLL